MFHNLNISPLMDPNHFWKEREPDASLYSNMDSSLSINKKNLEAYNHKLQKTSLILHDNNLHEENISIPNTITHLIYVLDNTLEYKIKRHIKVKKDVTITIFTKNKLPAYIDLTIECEANLDLHIYESERDSITKLNTILILNKENVSVNVNMSMHIKEGQKRDDFIEFQHSAKKTHSDVKYICLNNGIAISQANSLLDKNSRVSESYQSLKHILLSPQARSYAKPNLMILNPDVMAKHGTNIGSIKIEDIQYLEMRGFNQEEAKKVIQESLIKSSVDNHPFTDEIKDIYYD